jgi:hypothetical protein
MSKVFSFRRWWRLVGLHYAENRRRYLLTLLAVAGLLVVWYSFVLVMDRDSPLTTGYQIATFFVGLFFLGCIYGSQVFSALSRKQEAIQYLMVPASHLEKLLCGLFFGVLLFFIAYTLLFYVVDIPMVHLAQGVARHARPGNIVDLREISVYNVFAMDGSIMPGSIGILLLLIFFAVQAGFILGSVYFTRYAIVKSIIAMLGLCLLATFFMTRLVAANLPDGWRLAGLFDWFRFEHKEEQYVRLPRWITGILYALMFYSLPFLFWVVTYFRLKEKEV